jgi:YgiT-type zinc finger domain-containing protein
LIYDYYKKIEARTSELGIIAEKAIEFREFEMIGGGNRMEPGECLLCKSKMREGTTEFVARVGDHVVVIKNIPAFVCPNCNEAYYSIEIQRKIDGIMRAFHEGRLLAKPLAAGEVDLKALEACQTADSAAIEGS